jgi:hypothetical protein
MDNASFMIYFLDSKTRTHILSSFFDAPDIGVRRPPERIVYPIRFDNECTRIC